MGEVIIYNFVTNEVKTYSFEDWMDAYNFACDYQATDEEEVNIGNGLCCMELSDYFCACAG